LRGGHNVNLNIDTNTNANLEAVAYCCRHVRRGSLDRMVSTLDRGIEDDCTGCDAIALRSSS
jgi:hypothetical protein